MIWKLKMKFLNMGGVITKKSHKNGTDREINKKYLAIY